MQPHRLEPILFTPEQIRRRVEDLAAAIAGDYRDEELIIVAVLKGSFVFLADLVRRLTAHRVHPIVDFLLLSSYGSGTRSTGDVRVLSDLAIAVDGRRVLLLDDILDTGLTLQAARARLLDRGAREVRTCVLLDKPARRAAAVAADYVGFHIDNLFAVGYGLDYDGRYRQLPHIAAVTFDGPAQGHANHGC